MALMIIYTYAKYGKKSRSDGFIKYALADYYGREVGYIKIGGKPKAEIGYVSLAHSARYLVVAVSDNPVGVDVERIIERNWLPIAERYKFKCTTLEGFYRDWCAFESNYKINRHGGGTARYFDVFDNTIVAVAGEGDVAFKEIPPLEE